MVDALGATGYEGMRVVGCACVFVATDRSPSSGIFRRAAEVTFEELRTNRDSLTSVLEAFIHDPLTEWQAAKVRAVVFPLPDTHRIIYPYLGSSRQKEQEFRRRFSTDRGKGA